MHGPLWVGVAAVGEKPIGAEPVRSEFNGFLFIGDPPDLVGSVVSVIDIDGDLLHRSSDLRLNFVKVSVGGVMHYFVDRDARKEDIVVAADMVTGVSGQDDQSVVLYWGSLMMAPAMA